MMEEPATVTRIGPGAYRVDVNGRIEVVYVAGAPDDRWAFWNGQVFRAGQIAPREPASATRGHVPHSLSAPMPATVLKVLVAPGASVNKGDTVIVLEAMKMELPIRAPGAARVTAVHCSEGDLVQPDTVLIELE